MNGAAGTIHLAASCENQAPDEALMTRRRFSPAPDINAM
jgi:hypothetical protein